MFNQIKKVMMVYTSGWTFRLVSGLAVLLFIAPLVLSNSTRHTNVLPQPSAWTITTIRSKDLNLQPSVKEEKSSLEERKVKRKSRVNRLKEAYDHLNLKSVDWKKFDMSADGVRVHSNADYAMWKRMEEMEHLEFLDMRFCGLIQNKKYSDDEITELHNFGLSLNSDLNNLGKFTKLKSFRSPRGKFQAKDLEYLASIKKLRWLDISRSKLNEGLESIPVCENLEILHILNSGQLTQAAVQHLNSFPKLKTLYVTTFDASDPPGQMMENAFSKQSEIISGLTKIETLHLPHLMVYGHYAKPIVAAQMNVYPSSVNATRINTMTFYVFMLVILSISIGVVLMSQFSRPESLLTPRYFLPHAYVAGILLILSVIGACIPMIDAAVNPFSAFAISLLAVSPLILMVLPQRIQNSGFIAAFLLIPFFQIMLFGFFASVFIEQFLIGLFPIVTLLIATFGISLTTLAVSRMQFIHEIFVERGIPVPIMGLSDIKRLQNQGMGNPKSPMQSWIMKLNFPVEAQFKKLKLASNISTDEKHFRTWKIASGKTSQWIKNLAVLILLFVQGNWFFQNWMSDSSPTFEKPMYFLTWVMMLIMSAYFGGLSCSGWWQRIPMMSRELCLPMTRSTILQNLYRGILSDIVWIPFVIVLFGSPIFIATHTLPQYLLWMSAYFASSFGISCIMFGTVLYSLSLSKSWQKILLGLSILGVLLAIIFAIPTLVVSDFLSSKNINMNASNLDEIQRTIFGTGIVFFMLGSLLIYFAKERWSKLEFAKLV